MHISLLYSYLFGRYGQFENYCGSLHPPEQVQMARGQGVAGRCQPFDGFPKSGQLAELSNKPVVFQAKGLKAAPSSVHMPRLQDVQVGQRCLVVLFLCHGERHQDLK
jgi:hypothetical protein